MLKRIAIGIISIVVVINSRGFYACAASIANKYRGAYFNADSMYLAMKKMGIWLTEQKIV